MFEMNVPYDKGQMKIKLEDKNLAGVLEGRQSDYKTTLSENEIVEQSLNNPIGSKSLEELAAIRDKMKQTVNTREAAHDSTRVVVGMATCGIAAGARPVLNAFTEEVARRDLHGVLVTQTGCIGICQYEPVVEITCPGQEKVTYVKMTPEKVARVVSEHLVGGHPVTEYTIGNVR